MLDQFERYALNPSLTFELNSNMSRGGTHRVDLHLPILMGDGQEIWHWR